MIVRCVGVTCKHNDGGYCKAEAINLQDRDYFDEMGEPATDDMCCITYEQGKWGEKDASKVV